MTDSQEMQQWNDSWEGLLQRRKYQHPKGGFALGLATPGDEEHPYLDTMYFPGAVNVEESNQVTLAFIAGVLRDRLDPGVTGTTVLNESDINTILLHFPDELRKSATPEKHGNVWALMQMLKYCRADMRPRRVPVIHISHDLMSIPQSVPEVYLRLTTQSLRLTVPGITSSVVPGEAFGLLPNLVWSTVGVYTLDEFDRAFFEHMAQTGDSLQPTHQDKIPRMLDYVRPEGVRIAGDVRLGASLAPGTTVMHAGFMNFNAVTLGKAMVEGRISAGVVVGADSDIGGGASTQGTMSGGNNVRVSIGSHCLLEANSGLGIPIGDRCRVEAGFYLKSTTPVLVREPTSWQGSQQTESVRQALTNNRVKALDLAGICDAVFRRNAGSGEVEVVFRGDSIWGNLNSALHDN